MEMIPLRIPLEIIHKIASYTNNLTFVNLIQTSSDVKSYLEDLSEIRFNDILKKRDWILEFNNFNYLQQLTMGCENLSDDNINELINYIKDMIALYDDETDFRIVAYKLIHTSGCGNGDVIDVLFLLIDGKNNYFYINDASVGNDSCNGSYHIDENKEHKLIPINQKDICNDYIEKQYITYYII